MLDIVFLPDVKKFPVLYIGVRKKGDHVEGQNTEAHGSA